METAVAVIQQVWQAAGLAHRHEKQTPVAGVEFTDKYLSTEVGCQITLVPYPAIYTVK